MTHATHQFLHQRLLHILIDEIPRFELAMNQRHGKAIRHAKSALVTALGNLANQRIGLLIALDEIHRFRFDVVGSRQPKHRFQAVMSSGAGGVGFDAIFIFQMKFSAELARQRNENVVGDRP